MKLPVPVWLTAVVCSCVAIHCFPATHPWLWYHPEAITGGQWWRLLTCHLVHFSTEHLVLNLAAFGVISFLFARLDRAPNPCALIAAMFFVSMGLLFSCPGMDRYAGLSGIVTFLAWQFALKGLEPNSTHRVFYVLVLFSLALKLACEPLMSLPLDNNVITEPKAHLFGATVAVLLLACNPRRSA